MSPRPYPRLRVELWHLASNCGAYFPAQSNASLTGYLGDESEVQPGQLKVTEDRSDLKFRSSLWLWPNLLNLDAVFIAVVWQHFLSETISAVQPVNAVVLGLSVWLVYTTDRLVDTHSTTPPRIQSPRHQFAQAHRRPLLGAVAILLVIDLCLAIIYLPPVSFLSGMILVAAVAARFPAVLRPGQRPRAKEMWTPLIFVAGVWTPTSLANPPGLGAVRLALFCWWNCLAIDTWEARQGSRPVLAMSLILALASFGFFTRTHRPAALAESVSAAGYRLLASQGEKLSRNLPSVAVYFCRLSPVLVYAH